MVLTPVLIILVPGKIYAIYTSPSKAQQCTESCTNLSVYFFGICKALSINGFTEGQYGTK